MDLDILYIKLRLNTLRVITLNLLEKYSTEIVMEVENQLFILLFWTRISHLLFVIYNYNFMDMFKTF